MHTFYNTDEQGHAKMYTFYDTDVQEHMKADEGVQGPKKGYLGFALTWRRRDERPTRLRAACAAKRRSAPTSGKASRVYGKGGNS